jgi:hypothetical protein
MRLAHKFLLLFLVAAVPLAVVGSVSLVAQWRQLKAERQRLTALRYLAQLQQLSTDFQLHRAASAAALAGDAAARPVLTVYQERIDDAIAAMDDLDRALGRRLASTPGWNDVQDRWEDVRATHPFRSPEQSVAEHTELQAKVTALAAAVADRGGLLTVQSPARQALADALVFRLPALVEAMSRARASAALADERPVLGPVYRRQLHELTGQARAAQEAVWRNTQAAFARDPGLRDALETPLVEKTRARRRLPSSPPSRERRSPLPMPAMPPPPIRPAQPWHGREVAWSRSRPCWLGDCASASP